MGNAFTIFYDKQKGENGYCGKYTGMGKVIDQYGNTSSKSVTITERKVVIDPTTVKKDFFQEKSEERGSGQLKLDGTKLTEKEAGEVLEAIEFIE